MEADDRERSRHEDAHEGVQLCVACDGVGFMSQW